MALLQWWGGEGAVRVLRRDGDAILMPGWISGRRWATSTISTMPAPSTFW